MYFCVFCADVSRIASEIQAKFHAFSEIMSRLENCENKQGEKYNGIFSVSKKRNGKGKKIIHSLSEVTKAEHERNSNIMKWASLNFEWKFNLETEPTSFPGLSPTRPTARERAGRREPWKRG